MYTSSQRDKTILQTSYFSFCLVLLNLLLFFYLSAVTTDIVTYLHFCIAYFSLAQSGHRDTCPLHILALLYGSWCSGMLGLCVCLCQHCTHTCYVLTDRLSNLFLVLYVYCLCRLIIWAVVSAAMLPFCPAQLCTLHYLHYCSTSMFYVLNKVSLVETQHIWVHNTTYYCQPYWLNKISISYIQGYG